MSFRVRVLALTMFMVVAATAATAWLTLRQVQSQARESVTSGTRETTLIVSGLRRYGLFHGTWNGVAATVDELAASTGQRIRVATGSDTLLADSDLLAGRAARPVPTTPILVDPRPELRVSGAGQVKVTALAISRYRVAARYATCLARAGIGVTTRLDREGIPQYTALAGGGQAAKCGPQPVSDVDLREDALAVEPCMSEPAGQLASCLRQVFDLRTGSVAPQRVQVYLGALDNAGPSFAVAPTVTVAAAVAAAAILGGLLLSRAVLRPVRALTGASRELGKGDLGQRVPVSGRDEIAELGRSFNRMAGSLQASEERQRRLVGDVAHELRTPLANLRGYLEALRDGVVDPGPELLDSLHEEVMLQKRIIDDLQDLTLAEAGALTYHRADTDLHDLLETCRTAHRALAESAGVTLDVEATGTARAHVDPDRLRQALGNLVTNAVRAAAPGGDVRLVLVRHGELCIIQVRDTGKGIPAEDLPHVFDRFWRADAARGRTTGGSGLGLSIVRQIVSDHQGVVDVESTVGEGTVFTIVLAAVPAG